MADTSERTLTSIAQATEECEAPEDVPRSEGFGIFPCPLRGAGPAGWSGRALVLSGRTSRGLAVRAAPAAAAGPLTFTRL